MQFTLTLKLGNDAIQTYADISGVLAQFVRSYDYEQAKPGADDFAIIFDDNGNTVGRWEITESA